MCHRWMRGKRRMVREPHGASVHWSMARGNAFYRSPLPPIRPE
ncbi:hypothetical protein [Bacteroides pyogenes]|nr:hypothetical protein [Bacteroides pyogenes]